MEADRPENTGRVSPEIHPTLSPAVQSIYRDSKLQPMLARTRHRDNVALNEALSEMSRRWSEATPGNKVAILRWSLGLPQSAIAKMLDVTRQSVGAYETRQNASPSPSGVKLLSDAFGVSLEWFYDREFSPPAFETSSDENGVLPGLEGGAHKLLRVSSYFSPDEPIYEISPAVSRATILRLFPVELHSVLMVAGEALGDRAPHGSLVVFRKQASPPPHTLALLQVREEKDYRVRKLIMNSEDELSTRSFDEEIGESSAFNWTIVGAAVAIIRSHPTSSANIEFDDGRFLRIRSGF